MADRDDWTWQEWGRASIGWRLSVFGRAAGRLLVLALRPPFLALRAARHRVKAVEPWGIMLAVIGLGLLLVAFWIDYTTLWKFVRDEPNNRGLIAIFTGGIFVGTVVPLIAGAIIFFLNARIAARQAVYNYLDNWLSPARQETRLQSRKIMTTGRDIEKMTIEERSTVSQHLNSLELMAIYLGSNPVREREAKLFIRSILLSDWHLARRLVMAIRLSEGNPKIYENIEYIATRWSPD